MEGWIDDRQSNQSMDWPNEKFLRLSSETKISLMSVIRITISN